MAKILVAYATRLGATRGIAVAIAAGLHTRQHDVTVQSVEEPVDVSTFDAVVLGSGVFAGHWHKPAMAFARHNAKVLAARPTWLSSGCRSATARSTWRSPIPSISRSCRHIRPREGRRVFWGAFDRPFDGSDLNPVFRFAARKFIPEGDWREWAEIEAWAGGIAADLSPAVAA